MRETLLRSHRVDEWGRWGFVFDSSLAMAEAAVQGVGVALLPARMFERDLRQGREVLRGCRAAVSPHRRSEA